MNDLSFFTPVCVKTDDSVQLIGSVRDALRFLYEWPPDRRGPAFGCAPRSAYAPIAAQLSVEQARQAFVSFAGITGTYWLKTDAAQCGQFQRTGMSGVRRFRDEELIKEAETVEIAIFISFNSSVRWVVCSRSCGKPPRVQSLLPHRQLCLVGKRWPRWCCCLLAACGGWEPHHQAGR